jgi:hypothetical protein
MNNNLKVNLLFGNLSNSERDLYDTISELIGIPDIMHILDSSEFFVKEYLKQTFKNSSRWKIDKIHPTTGVKLKASNEKILRDENKNRIRHRIGRYNRGGVSFKSPNLELKNFIQEKKTKLRYFTQGSQQKKNQFERWSPEEMYNWWFNLRTSPISKLQWKIMDAVFFLFINQISCICNSYIIYGIKKNSNNKKIFKEELELLYKYFRLLDEFYKSGGEYGKLLDTHISFCLWFERRIAKRHYFNKREQLHTAFGQDGFMEKNITKIFNKIERNNIISQNITTEDDHASRITLKYIRDLYSDLNVENNYTLILFTSFLQNPSIYINLYSIPIITALGIPQKSHRGYFYTPFSQIYHDIQDHNRRLSSSLILIYSQPNFNDNDIKIFMKKMIFLQLLWKKKALDAQLLIWFIIHEMEHNIESIMFNTFSDTFLDPIGNNKNKFTEKNKEYLELSDRYYNFFDIDFLLKQLLILKNFFNKFIGLENISPILNKLVTNIDILIDTCNETFEYIKNANAKDFLEFNNLLESMNLDKLNNVNRQKYLKNFNIKYEKLSENKKGLYTNNYIEKSMLLTKLRNNKNSTN